MTLKVTDNKDGRLSKRQLNFLFSYELVWNKRTDGWTDGLARHVLRPIATVDS